MFGLSFEKLLVIAIIAVFIVGPSRLPGYAERLAGVVRGARSLLETTRQRVEEETGMPVRSSEWQQEWRRYDPRRIMREALQDAPTAPESAATSAEPDALPAASPSPRPTAPAPVGRTEVEAGETASDPMPPRPRWVVVGGSSGHPKRVRVPAPELEGGVEEESPSALAS